MRKRKSASNSIWLPTLLLILSGSAWSEQSRALKPGESLAYEKEYEKNKGLTILRVYYESKVGRELVREYFDLACNAPQLSQDRRMIFFVLNLRDDKYDPYYLYTYDGKSGSDRKLFKATCQYSVTPDARYVCFERGGYRKVVPWPNGKGENALSIPVVVLVDLSTMEEKSFDFVRTFLKDQWGAGVYIKYDVDAKGFRLRFFMEERSYSKGIISLQDFKYHEEPK